MLRRAPLLVLLVPALAGAERAERLRSYWDEGRTTIFSDVRVVHDDGTVEVRRELGGSVDGIAMIQIPLYARAPAAVPYVPTVNDSGARLRWAGSWIFLTPDRAGTADIDGDGETEVLRAAAEAWNAAVAPCSYITFKMKPAEDLEVRLDGKNTVKYRGDRWCRPPLDGKPERCYDQSATAITTLFIVDSAGRPDNGVILDTDIEVNTVDYAMATGCETRCATSGSGQVEDLQNTLTHELGHVLGLDHTCFAFDPNAPHEPPLDDQGQPTPSCNQPGLSDAIVHATMYTYQDAMETEKRTPEADDVAGVCATYPTAADPMLYHEVEIGNGGGCAAAGAPRRGRGWAALLAALVALTARACSRSRRR